LTAKNSIAPCTSLVKERKGRYTSAMLKRLLLGIISLYQRFVSPFFPPRCRFYPTCSQYGAEAISKYGPFKGGYLALRRVLRCHPFHPGGFDPVP